MAPQAPKHVFLSRDGDLGWLKLQGAPVPTLTTDSVAEFRAALRSAAADEEVRALVIAGAPKVFLAGADVKLAQECRDPEFAGGWLRAGNALVRELAEFPKPTVCAVEGAAFGAGCNIPLACDLIAAADTASFSQAFIKIGLATDMGSLVLLPRRVGFQRAREMMYTGRTVGSEEASEMGLIDERIPAGDLESRAAAMAMSLARAPAAAFAAIKAGMAESGGLPLRQALETETRHQMDVFTTDDFIEGTNAFLEKRSPRFGGAKSSSAVGEK